MVLMEIINRDGVIKRERNICGETAFCTWLKIATTFEVKNGFVLL